MSKELLRSMLDDVINDRDTEASTGLHDYLRAKMRNMIGVSEAAEAGQDVIVRLSQPDRYRSDGNDDIELSDLKADLEAAGIKYKDLRIVDRADGKRQPRKDAARFVVLGGMSEEELADELDGYEVEFE